jgi:glycosyltransferase involved in cell wall biosynthesis
VTQFPVASEAIRSRSAATKPAVTVAVTLYNYERFVLECLDSLLRQTQKELEIVVVDDASTDGGLSAVSAWLEAHEREIFAYQVHRHHENMGLPVARNTGFTRASADLVFAMDADNTLYPRAIARCREAIEASGADGAYTQLELFGARSGIGLADFWSRERFQVQNYVDAMALLKKSAWQKVGGYTQLSVSGWEDYDFWCKFVEQGLRCTFVPEILCRYRVHDASMSATVTIPKTHALVIDMSIRHPWLHLHL